MSATPRRWGVQPTRDGVAFGVFGLALFAVAFPARDNLLYLIVATLAGIAAVAVLGALVAVRGVSVTRRLPDELFAGWPASGGWEVRRSARWPLIDLRIEECDAGGGHARVAHVEAGGAARVGTAWRFDRRGHHALRRVRLRSSAPFGLLEVWRELDLPTETWVWPRPASGGVQVPTDEAGHRLRSADPDDLDHLRPYRPGDRPRDVHWATSARVGRPMVVVRAGAAPEPVWVEVPPLHGDELEVAISEATGVVLDAVAAHRPVGLRAGGRVWPPRVGAAWRRELLTALAALGTA